MNTDAELFVHADPIPPEDHRESGELNDYLAQDAKLGTEDFAQEQIEVLPASVEHLNGTHSPGDFGLPRVATDEVLKNFGRRVHVNRHRVRVKRERKWRQPAHISTLNRLRDMVGKELPIWHNLPFFENYNIPETSELLDLAWHYYPPRAKLKAYVCDIYNDHSEQTEILVGNMESCMTITELMAYFSC
jgi:hypothetical protein